MKNMIGLLGLGALLFILYSCGPAVPAKEIEDAKSALERAKTVDAPVFAAKDYMDAESDYNDANKFVQDKKNQEAKDKALTSKTKADKSYDAARAGRAEDIFKKCGDSLKTAQDNFAEKIMPDKFADAQKGYEALKGIYDTKDYDSIYSNGSVLYPKIKEMADACSAAVDKARNAVANAQDAYDMAENKEIVRQYALEDLQKAVPVLDEARKMLEESNLDSAIAKAKEAEDIIAAAEKKAQDAFDKSAKTTSSSTQTIDLDKQKELDNQKKQASDAIEEAKKKLEQLKSRTKGSFLNSSLDHFAYVDIPFIYFGEDVADITSNSNAVETQGEPPAAVKDENITVDMVEKNIKMAEDSYAKEEYLDSIDYAKEAIRMADILLAKEQFLIYTVKLRPENRDCLWKISGYMYEDQYWMWPVIWRANKYQIQDPDLIYPGQELKIPPAMNK